MVLDAFVVSLETCVCLVVFVCCIVVLSEAELKFNV